jgi:uncharacterized protein YcfL
MKRVMMIASVFVFSFVLTGCSAIDKPPHAVKADNVSEAQYPQIATEGNLGNHLSYAKPIVRPPGQAPGQTPMRVTVPIRLRDNKAVNAQYRFTFLGADGGPVGQAMDWRFMVLPPRLQVFMEGSAMDMQAVDWRLEIRPAK